MDDSGSDFVSGPPVVYKRRWYLVLVLSWLNVTNGMLWISYANISDKTAIIYGTTVANVNWFSLIFPIITIVLGLPSFWALDRMGIRISFNVCAMLNLLSATLRLLCSYESVTVKMKFPLAMFAQVLGSLAQPLAMFSPARLASLWFAPEQRASATTLAALGNPLGVLIGSFLPPLLLESPMNRGFTNLALVLFALALVGALLSCLGICHSTPPRPPAISSDRPTLTYTFFAQLRLCLVNRQFVILALVFGVALGLFSTLSTLIEQILCPYGYSSTFAGYCGALLIGCGLVGALVSGIVADKTQALTEIVQVCFVLSTFGLIAFAILTVFANMQTPIIVSVCWIGTFGVALYSVCIELAAEVTFPASENISTGLLVVSGQIFSVIFILLSLVLTRPMTVIDVPVICGLSPDRSFWPLNMMMSLCAVLASSAILILFSATYRRRATDAALISAQEDYGRDLAVSVSE